MYSSVCASDIKGLEFIGIHKNMVGLYLKP